MYFVMYCRDIADGIDLRMANRPAHLEYAQASDVIRMAGPMFAEDGATMIGSLFVIEVDDIETARRFNSEDPYTRAGLFENVEIHPFRWALGTVQPSA